ncbi:nuclear transport factor 2 family protein [Spirosoma rhododendri]|uniref:Nuclear transport factor 2 family protein n=1 Tax=Spirosoma rhododendri TaxID=2728024 RepID=A0A7L5DPL9_9BACT|nr:nuclear transport factor 2 family protein [Spirosoma rhododendri]QJD79421.1 nuclear transport factor 2 family protein [Spirosoma rhododendri]
MRKCLLIYGLLLTGLISQAQTRADVEKTISDLEQIGVKGILTADTSLLVRIWAPEFMVTTPRNTIALNRAAVFKNQKQGLIDYSSFERVIEQMQIQENVVITMGYELFVAKHDLQEAKAGQPTKRRFTNVWLKRNGQWLQIGRHASIICVP